MLTATASCRDARSAPVARVRRSSTPAIAITHVTVIDMTGAPPRPDMTVVLLGDRITGIGPSDSLSPPVAAVVVEGRGKFVIPGLRDMHAHSTFDRYQRAIAFPRL